MYLLVTLHFVFTHVNNISCKQNISNSTLLTHYSHNHNLIALTSNVKKIYKVDHITHVKYIKSIMALFSAAPPKIRFVLE